MPFNRDVLGARYDTFEMALSLLLKMGGKNIVETGCIRWVGDIHSGGSTILFGLIAKEYGMRFDSIDISEKSINNAKETTKDISDYINFHQEDSIKALQNWKMPIDLIYLDSFGGSEPQRKLSQIHQLNEVKAVYDKVSKNGLILLDDTSRKTELSRAYLINKGCTLLLKSYQCLFIKNE